MLHWKALFGTNDTICSIPMLSQYNDVGPNHNINGFKNKILPFINLGVIYLRASEHRFSTKQQIQQLFRALPLWQCTVLQCHQHRAVHWCIVRHCISLHWFEQVQEVQTRHKTQFWSSSNFVLMFKLHPIFYSVAAKCKTWPSLSKYQVLVHQLSASWTESKKVSKNFNWEAVLRWTSLVEGHICISNTRPWYLLGHLQIAFQQMVFWRIFWRLLLPIRVQLEGWKAESSFQIFPTALQRLARI